MVPSPCVAFTLSLSHGAWDRVRATQGNDERDYEKEAEPSLILMNCTPKVRQKTFGVQFVYEKDICRKT